MRKTRLVRSGNVRFYHDKVFRVSALWIRNGQFERRHVFLKYFKRRRLHCAIILGLVIQSSMSTAGAATPPVLFTSPIKFMSGRLRHRKSSTLFIRTGMSTDPIQIGSLNVSSSLWLRSSCSRSSYCLPPDPSVLLDRLNLSRAGQNLQGKGSQFLILDPLDVCGPGHQGEPGLAARAVQRQSYSSPLRVWLPRTVECFVGWRSPSLWAIQRCRHRKKDRVFTWRERREVGRRSLLLASPRILLPTVFFNSGKSSIRRIRFQFVDWCLWGESEDKTLHCLYVAMYNSRSIGTHMGVVYQAVSMIQSTDKLKSESLSRLIMHSRPNGFMNLIMPSSFSIAS